MKLQLDKIVMEVVMVVMVILVEELIVVLIVIMETVTEVVMEEMKRLLAMMDNQVVVAHGTGEDVTTYKVDM